MPDLIVTSIIADMRTPPNWGREKWVYAVVVALHRLACEAAQLHLLQHPKSVEFMEAETGRKGWRAYMSDETAHAVEALEEHGVCRFVHVDDA